MWNKPQLMAAVSDLLIVAGAAALLVAALIWAARLPFFPLHEVTVTNELREIKRGEVEASLAGRLQGNFFSVDLEGIRRSLEQLSWVRRVEVRRQWPGRIEVSIEEHRPAAYWGADTGQLVNTYGEVFVAGLGLQPGSAMPVLTGPSGWAPEMLRQYQTAAEALKPLGLSPRALSVSPRLALQMQLDDGTVVELGREQTKATVSQRMQRLVENYESMLRLAGQRPGVVDMRYPNGFAMRIAAATDSRGKP